MAFDPDALKTGTNSKKSPAPKSERLFLVVDSYETPADGFHFAVGRRFDNPDEVVRVRLNTVEERIKDRPKLDPEKIRSQYFTGENTRDPLVKKKEANIKLLAFDDAILIKNEGGVSEYRAHWGQTISTEPEAEIVSGMAHIRLREAGENQRSAQAYVEMIKDAVVIDGTNARKVLTDAMAITDDKGRGRDPFAIVRINYNGTVYGTARIYPVTGTKSVFDQNLGSNKEVPFKLDGQTTVNRIMSGDIIGDANGYINQQADIVRAIVAGLEGADLPVLNDNAHVDRNKNMYAGAKVGQLVIEVLPCEKIEFGPDSRKTYLNDKFKVRRYHLQGYDIPKAQDGQEVNLVSGYTKTVVGFQRHPDGTPYAVYASPTETFPNHQEMKAIVAADLAAPAPAPAPEPEMAANEKKKKSASKKAESSASADGPSM